MSLLQLPPELLIQVMDYVGSSFFAEDLERLIICKYWFSVACSAYFKHLRLCQKTLRRLLSSQFVDRNLSLVKDNLEFLDIDLKGFEDWNYEYLPGSPSDPQDLYYSDMTSTKPILAVWTTVLNHDLTQLYMTAEQSWKFRGLHIRAWSERHPHFHLRPRRDYLFLSTVRTLLMAEHLSVLELDLCGTLLVPRDEDGDDPHICTSISALLPTLSRLKLRMRSICAGVLTPSRHDTKSLLKEVLINLSLSNESPLITSAAHSTPCDVAGGGTVQLMADIEDQAKALVACMESPKIVRILTHTLPNLELRSLDVLTGKSMTMTKDMAWEDDGEAIVENEPDPGSD
ncbi:hypothetical protein BU24DRAFT_339445 [Aaosphaeria arxii CBS 175.79]|uniref:F-box domain-containing protein n=1 Tax=Aaosphaeria arxii CBS 175.79 TaxID=1450172 RepID=A0A6A5YAY0_9PLEO|nr:uncharacterized protein BU24DRAFT_339445 [Aaosphaeria arxii CBS 175.79]KAF2021851.1 hypothetical protein BU24DRAFT_339445 [Aaosphaeria arxii CBS 175.79]